MQLSTKQRVQYVDLTICRRFQRGYGLTGNLLLLPRSNTALPRAVQMRITDDVKAHIMSCANQYNTYWRYIAKTEV